jgi:hypothetical protein
MRIALSALPLTVVPNGAIKDRHPIAILRQKYAELTACNAAAAVDKTSAASGAPRLDAISESPDDYRVITCPELEN